MQALAELSCQPAADAERAMRLTAAARHRQAEVQDEERAARESEFIRHLRGRAVPSWRRSLPGL